MRDLWKEFPIVIVGIPLLMVGLVLVGLLCLGYTHTYKGIAEVPIDTALQIQLDQGSEGVSLTTYSRDSDLVYITYNFRARESGLYGLESEEDIMGEIGALMMLFLAGCAILFIANSVVMDDWDK